MHSERGMQAYNRGLGGALSWVQGQSAWSESNGGGAKSGKSGVDMSTPVHPVATPWEE